MMIHKHAFTLVAFMIEKFRHMRNEVRSARDLGSFMDLAILFYEIFWFTFHIENLSRQ